MRNASTIRMVIAGLAGVLILGVLGVIVLAALEVDVPDVLSNVVVGALTALGAMLARGGETEDVHIVNTPAEPVPVEDGFADH